MIALESLNVFLDSLEEGIIFLDKSRRVVAINKAAQQMIGGRREDVLNELCPSIFSDTDCARACANNARCNLAPKKGMDRVVEDITLKQADGPPLFVRKWATILPAVANSQAYYAIILRNVSHEVQLEQGIKERLQMGSLVGHSPVMQELYDKILRLAASDATVLVTGESGTGKELVARALHDNSNRAGGPYVPLHCAALPEHLLESELFGHARGAFTGADSARPGRFEAAHGGTLLLDEIGEISPNIQVKLLRVLQEREVVRLGENHARKVDVRVIAATHRDIAAMVKRGEFREDLFYRLCILPLHVPPLRERKEDIALLSGRLLKNLCERYRRENVQLSHESLLMLEAYDWPGNIRQLSNVLEYALVHTDKQTILPHHLPAEVRSAPLSDQPVISSFAQEPAAKQHSYRNVNSPDDELAAINRALVEAGGNKAEAARRLGMSRTTLWKRLKSDGADLG
ncbi:MAG: sigma 54-interacting transcriptional regulator [Gallionellaceae bacterium]|nr:sigma 54-interacting transcriptional regulator [Gallionellaceae bacterium]